MSIAKSKHKGGDDLEFLDANGNKKTFDTEQKHFNIAFHADCMNFMKNIPDNYFTLCVVDPPYGDAQQKAFAGGVEQIRRKIRQI